MFAASTVLPLRFRLANNDLAKLSAGFEVPADNNVAPIPPLCGSFVITATYLEAG